MALASQRLHVNSNGIVENVLYSLADQDPKQYAESFQTLAAWVDNSLDLYRVRKTDCFLFAAAHISVSGETFY